MRLRYAIIFVLLSVIGFGQSQPENVPTRAGSLATIEYVTNQDTWLRLYFETEIRAIRQAVDKVEITNTNYRADANEWRGQSKDRENKYVTRGEIWTVFGGLVGMIFMALNYMKKVNDTKFEK